MSHIPASGQYNVITFAEGSGSILWLLMLLFPNSNLYYNTLIDDTADERFGPDQGFSPSVISDKRLKSFKVNKDVKFSEGETNITKIGFVKKFKAFFDTHRLDIMTIDAESKEGNQLRECDD